MPDPALPGRLLAALAASPHLAPPAQWRLLEAAFQPPPTAGAMQLFPACGALIAFAMSRQTWCLAWAVAVLAACVAVRRLAAAFAKRPADASPTDWARNHAGAVWAQSAILGVGGAMAAAGGNPLICLLTAVPLCFVAGADAAQAVLPGPVRGQLLLLLGPVVAGGLFGRQQAGLVVALLAAVALGMALAVAAATSARATQAASHIAPVAMPPVGHTLPPAAQDFQRLLGRCQVTGLPNRHSFAHLLVQESTRACSAETKLSLLLLQWDGFDTYSAAAKPARLDAQLAGLARRLGGELRRSADVLANLGDGRFAVLLPFTDASGAGTVARNLQAALRLPELGDGAEVGANRVSVSIGAATYCGKGPLPDDQLMRFAEEALSAARATGGDRVKNYDPIAATLRPAPYAGPRPKEEASARSRERLSG